MSRLCNPFTKYLHLQHLAKNTTNHSESWHIYPSPGVRHCPRLMFSLFITWYSRLNCVSCIYHAAYNWASYLKCLKFNNEIIAPTKYWINLNGQGRWVDSRRDDDDLWCKFCTVDYLLNIETVMMVWWWPGWSSSHCLLSMSGIWSNGDVCSVWQFNIVTSLLVSSTTQIWWSSAMLWAGSPLYTVSTDTILIKILEDAPDQH